MRNLTVAAAAIAIVAGLGAGPASADHNRGWQPQSHHHSERRAAVRRHAPAVEVVRVGVHRRFADENIPLRRMLGLDRDYRGYRIQSVTVKVRPRQSRARLALLADGHVVDRARAHHGRRIELTPDANRTLGHDLGRLQLAVRGSAFIDSIHVKLRPPHHERRGYRGYRTGHERHERTPDLAEQMVRIILGQLELDDARY